MALSAKYKQNQKGTAKRLAPLMVAGLMLPALTYAQVEDFRPGISVDYSLRPGSDQVARARVALPTFKFGKVTTFVEAELDADSFAAFRFSADDPVRFEPLGISLARFSVGAQYKSYEGDFAPANFQVATAKIFKERERNFKSTGFRFGYQNRTDRYDLRLSALTQSGVRETAGFEFVSNRFVERIFEEEESRRELRAGLVVNNPFKRPNARFVANANWRELQNQFGKQENGDAFLSYEEQFGAFKRYSNRASFALEASYIYKGASSFAARVSYPVFDSEKFQLRVIPALRTLQVLNDTDSRFEGSLDISGNWRFSERSFGGFTFGTRRKLDFKPSPFSTVQQIYSGSANHTFNLSDTFSFNQRLSVNQTGGPLISAYEPRLFYRKNAFNASLGALFERTGDSDFAPASTRRSADFSAGYSRALNKRATLSLNATARIDWRQNQDPQTEFGVRMGINF